MIGLVFALAVSGFTGAPAQAASAHRIGVAGVTLALPAGWHSWVPSTAVQPTITDPLTRVVAVSAPFGFATGGCQIGGYTFPATAVAVVVVEWVPNAGLPMPTRLPTRPPSFDSKRLVLHPPPAIECFDGSGGGTEFAEHGRAFSTAILVGLKASPAAVARARAVLDTLRIQKR